eukprot:CAMPEP_0181297620 /NCGR_PEP_ID=MMETSP1101-20121128/5336_1 /TAXON_ID=46948 /ORGANISM="Rhodomonas abbreviata, Strain Caron Lab Isolate" /LENGTH=138 /DNA_ID=CAMNT_0023402567 /DNA_START=30 /DNA_END=446 /DNA_ORIENTATION=+
MSSGVTVADGVSADFDAFKKNTSTSTYMIFKIDGSHVVEESRSEDKNFETFLAELPADDCRYAVYSMDYTTDDGRPTNKIVFFTWVPDTAKVKSKMIYASTVAAVVAAFGSLPIKIHATDMSEITLDIAQAACKKGFT